MSKVIKQMEMDASEDASGRQRPGRASIKGSTCQTDHTLRSTCARRTSACTMVKNSLARRGVRRTGHQVTQTLLDRARPRLPGAPAASRS